MSSPRFWVVLVVLVVGNVIISNALSSSRQTKSVVIPYNVFKQQVSADNVTSITSTGESIIGTTRKAVGASSGSKDTATHFSTQRPSFADAGLEALLEKHHVTINANPPNPPQPFWETVLFSLGPALLIVGAFLYFSRRMAGGAGGLLGGFGQSKARLYDAEQPGTTFADVAGIDEVKQELQEVVDFLKEPLKYQRLGGRVPKGVLLIGPPGTGKTLLSRAVAGEAGVPFFSISAAEFIEAIVGVGASRVRDLFVKARQAAPAIVFIDELDAIGRSRAGSVRIGGHDEQEQTLNQVLTEMDGFDSREGVIVLAATNRVDVLDSALLRPGRFDRRVTVLPPDRRGRAAILGIHTRGVPLAPGVDLDAVAGQTPGLVGADLRNLVNEAALAAARKGETSVSMEDFSDAIEKTLLGSERNVMLGPGDRERIAYHESGHALLGLLVPGADPVRKVTIVPRGMALGVTFQSPVTDRFNYGEDYLRARITGALGGRAAESLVYGVVTTGAENDLQQVTQIAHEMVVRWGMSPKIGPLSYGEEGPSGPYAMRHPYSEATAKLIDDEVKRIAEECAASARALLEKHRDKLDALVRALLEHDSLGEQEIREVTGLLDPTPIDSAGSRASRVRLAGGPGDGHQP
ncbi:MAG: ATP-dependent zinc metalloprotease FtsH [Candidatus Dormibacteraceae bacterium]